MKKISSNIFTVDLAHIADYVEAALLFIVKCAKRERKLNHVFMSRVRLVSLMSIKKEEQSLAALSLVITEP